MTGEARAQSSLPEGVPAEAKLTRGTESARGALDKWGVSVGVGMGHPTFVQVHLGC